MRKPVYNYHAFITILIDFITVSDLINMNLKKLLLVYLFFLPSLLYAQQSGNYLIKTGKLFDSEAGIFKTGMYILVKQAHIEAIKSEKELTSEEKKNHQLIDLSNYAVLPGLIDAHTHLLFKEEVHPNMDFSALSLEKTLTMQGDAYRAIYGAVRAKSYLYAGITAVQDLGNSGKFADVALKKAIEDGLVEGPRMRTAGQGLSSEGGQLPGLIYKHRNIVDDEYRIIKSADDAIQAVRENINQGADVIKMYADNIPNITALSVNEMKAIVTEAHRYGVRVTAHATSNQSIHDAIIAGADGIEHGYNVADSTLALMAKRKVILVPTDGDSAIWTRFYHLSDPDNKDVAKDVESYQKFLTSRLQRAIKQGVIIAAGSDDYLDLKMTNAESSKRTLIGYFESGATIPQILQFATINASRQLNWSKEIGILKKGYMADIIAVDLNIDTKINAVLNVQFVMKDGIIYVNK
jgi:imidazolonepropionase-like amidohydrolase